MPLTDLQKEILRSLADNRSPDSYLAGATVLHRDENSLRTSQDLDLFHDLAEAVASSVERDERTLKDAGYDIRWLLRTPGFCRATVSREEEAVSMEWAQDSAFRFFPVQEDEECGYCLHRADAAINKVLALAGRQEIRDYVDIIYLNEHYLSLGALVWAGCGKDPGYSPDLLLDQAGRHVAYSQNELDGLALRHDLSIIELKKTWLAAVDSAMRTIEQLPAEELGCLYLDDEGRPVNPDCSSSEFKELNRHFGSIKGAWPVLT